MLTLGPQYGRTLDSYNSTTTSTTASICKRYKNYKNHIGPPVALNYNICFVYSDAILLATFFEFFSLENVRIFIWNSSLFWIFLVCVTDIACCLFFVDVIVVGGCTFFPFLFSVKSFRIVHLFMSNMVDMGQCVITCRN